MSAVVTAFLNESVAAANGPWISCAGVVVALVDAIELTSCPLSTKVPLIDTTGVELAGAVTAKIGCVPVADDVAIIHVLVPTTSVVVAGLLKTIVPALICSVVVELPKPWVRALSSLTPAISGAVRPA